MADLLDIDGASRLVTARLGREPQDALEIAVVLEAWAGTPAQEALQLGSEIMSAGSPTSQPSVGTAPAAPPQEGLAEEALTFIVAVIAIACWTGPLAESVSAAVVGQALMLALPVTLGVQWALRSRYLSRRNGLELLGRRRRVLVLAAVGVVVVPAALFGASGVIAGLLTLTWTGGTILVRRGWAPLYAGLVALATVAMLAGLRPDAVVLLVADAIVVAVAVALPRNSSIGGLAPGPAG